MPPGITEGLREDPRADPSGDPKVDTEEMIRVYHFDQSIWRVTAKLTPNDVAVIIDPSQIAIYVWEGPRALPRFREQAKLALMSLKIQYPRYTFHPILLSKSFRRVKNSQTIPEKIIQTLQKAIKSES